ncbi:MAG: hypothetical protein R3F18_16160 [Lysobacterales bacterium]|nr:hypothetical protein [Xanthomonadales bacterium]MCP5474127.1 hypothetical protein [Rhodanobacteraceae bacterium]
MHRWHVLLLSALTLCALTISTARAATDPDEAWIERYMSAPGHSATVTGIRSGYRISWSELSQFKGVKVKVQTDTGRTHRGRIESVDDQSLLLRAELHGGYAELALRRNQVASTELE